MRQDNSVTHSSSWQPLGRYRVLRRIGKGGMGDVWLAEDPSLHRQVAIKTLPTHSQNDREFSLRFAQEAQAATALNHPHILSIHDFGEQPLSHGQSTTYIVMPYISGGSLAEKITAYMTNNTGMPEAEAIFYLQQAAEAIDYAHSQGVVHRDIKPANMLLRSDNWLLLADFGIARMLSSQEHMTQAGVGIGTPEYMALEQAWGKAEAASDRYSLAVIAYQLFTGRLPFQGATYYDALIKHIHEAPPSPRQFHPALPQLVEDILLQGLAKHPEERPASCLAFVNALEHGWNMDSPLLTDPEATVLAPWSKKLRAQVQEPQAWQSSPVPSVSGEHVEQLTMDTLQEQVSEEQKYIATVASVPSLPNTMNAGVQLQEPSPQSAKQRERTVSRRTVVTGGVAAAAVVVVSGLTLPTLLHHTSSITENKPLILGPKRLVPGVPVLNLTGHIDKVEQVVHEAVSLVALFEKTWQVIADAMTRWTSADLERLFFPQPLIRNGYGVKGYKKSLRTRGSGLSGMSLNTRFITEASFPWHWEHMVWKVSIPGEHRIFPLLTLRG